MTLSVLASFAFADQYRPLPPGSHLMLDSGGFSVWSKGGTIEVADLAAWYLSIPADRYAALDVIYDPQASRANALAMRDLGADVTPAVHAGTPPAEVDRLAADGFTTLALGGLVNRRNSRADADAWAHACLDRADACGMSVHGFGITPPVTPSRIALLLRFDSVDSTSWLLGRYRATPLWDGRRLVNFSINRDRLAIAALLRSWPLDFTPALTRQRGTSDPGGERLRLLQVAGAASLLAYSRWLQARGGPRIYLASYLGTFPAAWDAKITTVLDAIAPQPEAA